MALSEKSRKAIEAFEWTHELDRLALPLIPQVGVSEAYRQAALEMEGRSPCGGRREDLGGKLGSGERDLAGVRIEGSTRDTK